MKLRGGLALLAVMVATPAGFSQSRLGNDADRQQRLIERIAREAGANGPYSEALIGPLSDLALIYQDLGDHDLAVAVIHRVRQIVRANDGLHSLEQLPLLQQMIANEEALGRFETAWELQQDLLALARRHPGDLRTVPVFRETAIERMSLLNRYLAGELPQQIILGCYHGWPRGTSDYTVIDGDCSSGSKGDVIRAIVADAQTSYAHAIAVLLRNDAYSSDELRDLELGLLRSIETIRASENTRRGDVRNARTDLEPWRSWKLALLQLAEWNIPHRDDGFGPEIDEDAKVDPRFEAPYSAPSDYEIGRRSLERLWAYEMATAAPLQDQVEAFIRIADWDLVHGDYALALESYAVAHTALAAAGALTSIDALFAPKIPVVLPAFEPNPLASEATWETKYIDVAFEVSRYGESRRIEVLETSMNANATDKKRLIRLIQSSRFRPRVTEREFTRAAPVLLRYYLTE